MDTIQEFATRMRGILLTKDELAKMRNELKRAKGLVLSNTNGLARKLVEGYYEERVDTLPKSILYSSFLYYEEYKKHIGKADETTELNKFVAKMGLTYAKNGFGREKAQNELYKNSR